MGPNGVELRPLNLKRLGKPTIRERWRGYKKRGKRRSFVLAGKGGKDSVSMAGQYTLKRLGGLGQFETRGRERVGVNYPLRGGKSVWDVDECRPALKSSKGGNKGEARGNIRHRKLSK